MAYRYWLEMILFPSKSQLCGLGVGSAHELLRRFGWPFPHLSFSLTLHRLRPSRPSDLNGCTIARVGVKSSAAPLYECLGSEIRRRILGLDTPNTIA